MTNPEIRAAMLAAFPPAPITLAMIQPADARWDRYEERDHLPLLQATSWLEIAPDALEKHAALLVYAGGELFRAVLPAYLLLLVESEYTTSLPFAVANQLARKESPFAQEIFEERVGPMTAQQRDVVRGVIATLAEQRLLVLRPRRSERVVSKDTAGVFDLEGPADRRARTRSFGAPCSDLATKRRKVRDAPRSQALAADEACFHFGGVEPAPVLWRVVDFEAAPQCATGLFAEHVDASFLGVRAQVVDDQMDSFRLRKRFRDSLERSRKVEVRSTSRRASQSLASLRLDDAKYIRRSAPDVLVVGLRRLAGCGRTSRSLRSSQYDRTLIETYDWVPSVVRPCVQPEHIFHPIHELVGDRRHDPHFFPATA